MPVRLVTLGPLRFIVDGRDSGTARRKHSLGLLVYLGLEGAVDRDRLVTVLWPRVEPEKARHRLSQALYMVRKETGDGLIDTVSDRVALNLDLATIDARELEEAAAAEDWTTVTELYRGPFLDGFYLDNSPDFDDWQARTRTRLAALARRGFARVIEDHVRADDRDAAFTLALRWVDLDPLEDDAQHTLIQLLAERGNRSAALERFELYRERLADELEVEPLERTLELVRKIRAGEIAPPGPAVGTSAIGSGSDGESTAERGQADPLGETPTSLRKRLEDEFAGRLEIRGTLAEGSVASVFLAREPELNRLAAVKVFAPRLISDRRARARFEREARAIAALRHRNIVTLYWAETLSNGLPFIVMQYVKGRTLADRLKAQGRLSVAEARLAIISLAAALEAAHKQGIIHRDVNPGNLLYEEEEGRYLLSDFGFASMTLRDVGEPPSRLTESGEMIGRPGYRSPEQLMEKDLTVLSDIYAVGLVAYEILTGKPPYDVATGKGRLEARLGMSPAPSELRDDVDRRWDDLIDRCMAVEPTHRPSAADVVESARGLGDSPRGKEPSSKAKEGLLSKLLVRRVPHFVAAYLAIGFAALTLLGVLVGSASIPEVIYPLGLATYVLAFPAVLVGAWFHGRKGAQPISQREWWLYGGVALLWLMVCLAILVAG